MKIKAVMSKKPQYIQRTTTVQEAAEKMQQLGTGFLPIGDDKQDKLIGTLTDRDIVLRCVAKNKDISSTTVDEIMTKKVSYCFEEDPVEKAIESMERLQIRRLVVLNKDKRFVGVVTLGDIAIHTHNKQLSGEAIEKVSEQRRRAA